MRTKVGIGDLFEQTDAAGRVWRVVEVFTDDLGQEHALVEHATDGTLRKTIGVSALRDKHFFRKRETAGGEST